MSDAYSNHDSELRAQPSEREKSMADNFSDNYSENSNQIKTTSKSKDKSVTQYISER